MIENELSSMYENASKNKLKAEIFEWLKKNVKLELPKSAVDEEFNRQWESELKSNPDKYTDEKEKKKAQEEIRENAEDSIKLGLILSEIGKANKIEVSENEIIAELRKMASYYPGQEKMIIDFYMKNKSALNQITGNLLENKVVDFIINRINIEDEVLTSEEFNKIK